MSPDQPPVQPPAPAGDFLLHGDKQYFLTQPDQRLAMEAVKAEIVRLRGSSVAALIQNQQAIAEASPDLQRLIVQEAVRADSSRHVSSREMAEWITTLEGQGFMLLLSLRPRHPEVTPEIAMEIASEEIARAARKAALERQIAARDRQAGEPPAEPNPESAPIPPVELTEQDFDDAIRLARK